MAAVRLAIALSLACGANSFIVLRGHCSSLTCSHGSLRISNNHNLCNGNAAYGLFAAEKRVRSRYLQRSLLKMDLFGDMFNAMNPFSSRSEQVAIDIEPQSLSSKK